MLPKVKAGKVVAAAVCVFSSQLWRGWRCCGGSCSWAERGYKVFVSSCCIISETSVPDFSNQSPQNTLCSSSFLEVMQLFRIGKQSVNSPQIL